MYRKLKEVTKHMVTALQKATYTKNQKTLIKADFLTGSLGWTKDGNAAFKSILLAKHEAELVKLAEAAIKDRKEGK